MIMNQDQFLEWNCRPHYSQSASLFKADDDSFDLYLNLEIPSQQQQEIIPSIHETRQVNRNANQYADEDKIDQYLEKQALTANKKDNYHQQTRADKLERYQRKKKLRVWKKKVVYVSRQKVANDRQRVRGKFTSKKQMLKISATHDIQTLPTLPNCLGLKNELNCCTQS